MDGLSQLSRDYLEGRQRRLRRTASTCAIFAILLSAAVLLGWFLHPVRLAAAVPAIFEMRVNSAVGFGAAGVALLLLAMERQRAAAAVVPVPLIIGLLTLVEIATGVDLRFDELLLRDWSAPPGGHPGRLPPNTALTLVALAAGLGVAGLAGAGAMRGIACQIVSFLVIAIAMGTIAGDLEGSSFAIGWGSAQRMSFPAALCALALGAGLLSRCWWWETTIITRLPIWVPGLLCFGIVLLDVSTPLGFNAGICYIPVVLCAWWFERASVAPIFALVATLLIVFGFFASPAGYVGSIELVLINRGLAIAAVWLVAILVYLQHVAQRKLRRSKVHLAAAQKIADIGSFELYFGEMILRGSAAFDALHGRQADPPRDWDTFLRQAIPPDDREGIEHMLALARGGVRSRDVEYAFLRGDGMPRNALLHCELLFDSRGAPAGIIGVVHDVTELRRAQAQQAEIEMQLRHAQKMESLGMLAGGLAHDLNNTLVPVTTLMPLLLESAGPADRPALEIVIGAARRAKTLVREMLVFSRKDEPAHEPIRLDLLVRDTLTILRAGIPASIAIVDDLVDVPEITGSKGQIYQTILNLMTNAAHAIGDRAGTITIGARCAPADAGCGQSVHLYVADDGAGMDEPTKARIFEPFFTTKGVRDGTGLGLSIVRGIVTSHGGDIAVRSALGEGTRFDLTFPRAVPVPV